MRWPQGTSPLGRALVYLANHADRVWSLPHSERHPRYLILLSDGEGTGCPALVFPVPGSPTGDCVVDGLARAIARGVFESES